MSGGNAWALLGLSGEETGRHYLGLDAHQAMTTSVPKHERHNALPRLIAETE
jgi:hypothetical protein